MSDNDLRTVIDEIKTRLPISTYLEQQGYELFNAGPNRLKMLCPMPEHDEKTPSCIVPTPDGIQTCHCFGCGASFDIFGFVEKIDGIPFLDAVDMFAEQLHIDYKSDDYKNDNTTPRKILREIVRLTATALNRLYDKLDEDHAAKRNVAERKIPTENSKNFNIFGWAPEDDKYIVNALKSKGFTDKQLIDAGVARKWDDGTLHFPWRTRLMFIIRDLSGNPVGFTGRIVYDADKNKGKYVNSIDNPLFHKSRVLFCEDIARKPASETKTIYVVEGQFDVIACQHADRLNTVASSGTAFTEEHANLLRRLVTNDGRIVFMFDADEAGQKASLRTFKATPSIQSQSYATITKGDKDASDMFRDDPSKLIGQLDNIHPLYHHVIDWLASKHDLKDDNERRIFINDCIDAYKTITDPVLMDNFLTYVSLKTGADMNSLRAMAGKHYNTDRNKTDNSNQDVIIDGSIDSINDLQPEDYILALAIEQPDLRPLIKDLKMNRRYNKIQAKIASGNLNMTDATLKRLQTATEMMRQFEGYAPIVDVKELFEAQIQILNQKNNEQKLLDFHNEHINAVTKSTSPVNMRVYAENLSKIMNKQD